MFGKTTEFYHDIRTLNLSLNFIFIFFSILRSINRNLILERL